MPFHFKQFVVDDTQSAMKVGTDSVLLGAWINYNGASNILDIGTGCGLLALIAAQNTDASIVGIEINEQAYYQALSNFAASKWTERLSCILADFRDYSKELFAHKELDAHPREANERMIGSSVKRTFDLIISNPPYFSNSLKSGVTGRDNARHDTGLPISDLIKNSKHLLSEQGRLSVIFPYSEYTQLDLLCKNEGLLLTRQTFVIPKHGKEPNRILLEYSNISFADCEVNEIMIRDEHGKYTPEYLKLTEPYYLHLKQ